MKRSILRNKSGFTLVETLVAAAILAVLLAVSAVEVAGAQARLKITELDNAAREIYMAAQNQAVLLTSSKQLEGLVKQDDNEYTSLYYIGKDDTALARLVPTGSIDPALMDGDFVLVYEPKSGSVTDVFFAESTLNKDDFGALYDLRDKSREERMKEKPMVGYYGGGQAEADDIGAAVSPMVRVEIENGEELTVKVTHWLPKSVSAADLKVELFYLGTPIRLTESDPRRIDHTGPVSDSEGRTYTQTWVLDDLNGNNFSGLFSPGIAPGKDFTVTATLSGDSFGSVTDSDTGNSLFAKVSEDDKGVTTATISCLRHLQNLDKDFSKVNDDITKAEQKEDILCKGNKTYPNYNFIPIENGKLTSYDGKTKEIRGLYAPKPDEENKLPTRPASGLFSTAPATVTGVRLVNAEVNGGSNPAGALAGKATNATITDCRVYWEPEEGQDNLRSLLGSDGAYLYKIAGSTAGGLVGEMTGGSINNSFAATTVNGTTATGGLIGKGSGTVIGSYADCYLTGANAAGLVGNLAGDVTLTSCYAAGFIDGATKGAGLCLGTTGKTKATNVYTVMHCPAKDGLAYYYLTESYTGDSSGDSLINTYYRGAAVETRPDHYKTYQEMTANGFVNILNCANEKGEGGTGAFAWKDGSKSHPYNIYPNQDLVIYDFPGLAGLPHYGDWKGEPKVPSLVYYEQYNDKEGNESYGFSGGNIYNLVNDKTDKTIISDGYAILVHKDILKEDESLEFTLYYFRKKDGDLESESILYKLPVETADYPTAKEMIPVSVESTVYYLAILPKWEEGATVGLPDLQNGDFTSEHFYQYLRFECKIKPDGVEESIKEEYFYSPHFAETVIPHRDDSNDDNNTSSTDGRNFAWAEGIAGDLAQSRNTVSVRSARHLYGLSLYEHYYHNPTHRLVFQQKLNIDYSSYTGYDRLGQPAPAGQKTPLFKQQPIGSQGKPFSGTYEGGYHTIKGVIFQPDQTRFYAGLFGYSEGTLRNIVYEMDPEQRVTVAMGNGSKSLYAGGLVGGNDGTVQNCAVSGADLTGYSFGSTIYVGGLAGQNKGVIRDCAAETALLAADCSNFGNAYVGGLVGENINPGAIRTSYAVGRITAMVDTTSDARICGFAGYNSGSLTRCYAAEDLKSSGQSVETYGFCGFRNGSQESTFYLNNGNFTYRDISYTAGYTPHKAVPKFYEDLVKAGAVPGMGNVAKEGDKKTFPYPTAVKDASGKPVHYGDWPTPMDLGQMGIYYWEKLIPLNKVNDATYEEKTDYAVSLLAVDPDKTEIRKMTTLSTAHDDGKVVVEYGYGYYGRETVEVTATAENIVYKNNDIHMNFNDYTGTTVTTADEALAALMPGFTFHSYYTFDPNSSNNVGMYPTGDPYGNENIAKYGPNGAMTLSETYKNEEIEVTFQLNPHFADAMSVQNSGGFKTSEAPTAAPGTPDTEKQKGNPYGVRSVAQLELINWHRNKRDTRTVLEGTAEAARMFSYLSNSNNTGKYHWLQSHDLNGKSHDLNGNNKSYTPIAEYYDNKSGSTLSAGNLHGWFGGTYNGADYVIANINIEGQMASCAGLFGVVYNGTLKNIILYDSNGNGEINSGYFPPDNNGANGSQTAWYGIGALAGVAGVAKDNPSGVVQNCAVAGYTINAKTYTAFGWGGSNIGGLLGMTNMDLEGCSAVTTIKVPTGTNDNDNMRIGGLVGSSCKRNRTTSTGISNCYAGGSIQLDRDVYVKKGIYIGGLVGGSYMKPLAVNGNESTLIGFLKDDQEYGNAVNTTNNAFTNCYSYVELPDVNSVWGLVANSKTDYEYKIKSLYAVGGTGEIEAVGQNTLDNHGICTITNCYYYKNHVLRNNNNTITLGNTDIKNSEVTELTYPQMANQVPIEDGKYLCPDPDKNKEGLLTDFSPVTSEIDGYSVAGKYSFAPSNRKELAGINYPFPTILTRSNDSSLHVHYGEWPTYGIVRDTGGAPVMLDFFTKTDTSEKLKLSEVTEGGAWSVKYDDIAKDVANVTINDGTLEVKAVGEGSMVATIHYTKDGADHTFPLTINVTAETQLRPNRLTMFARDTVTVPITPHNRDGGRLSGTLNLVSVTPGEDLIARVTSDHLAVTLTSGEVDESKQQTANIHYYYTHTDGKRYPPVTDTDSNPTRSGAMVVEILPLPEAAANDTGNSWTLDFSGYTYVDEDTKEKRPLVSNLSATVTNDAAKAVSVGNILTITKKTGTTAKEIALNITLTMEGQAHRITMSIPIPESPTP